MGQSVDRRYKWKYRDPQKRLESLRKSYDKGILRISEILNDETIRDDSVLYLVVDRYESKLFVRLDTGEYELFGPDIVEYYEEVGDVRKDVDANDPDAIYDYLVKTVGAEVWSAYRECEGDEEDYRR